MSAFIVISVKESLNWIVDGIKDCRPHNPDVVTHLSTGKIRKQTSEQYVYEYAIYSKHAGDGNANETLANIVESDTPSNLFKNQIAKLLNVCENEGEQINFFLLDNPLTDEEFKHSTWLINELKEVHESHAVTNFQLVRVLFSYQIERPDDVTKQVSGMVLKQLLDLEQESSDDFLTRVLYVDNQNRNGAAMCLDKESHDIMLPRMLCDLMMLLSNKDDSYHTVSAISGETGVFAVGYSECMYYHDDVFRYYSIASKRDLTEFLLEDKNDEESLDYDCYPVGLSDRQQRLSAKYEKVPYTENIADYPDSIDRKIDVILNSVKDDLIQCKQDAIVEAEAKDREATELARKKKLDEILKESTSSLEETDGLDENELPEVKEPEAPLEERRGCNFLFRWFHRNKEISNESSEYIPVDPRVADIIITDEVDKVYRDYPEFIDRKEIYEQYLMEKAEGEYYEGRKLENNVEDYNALIRFLQSRRFLVYMRDVRKNPVLPSIKTINKLWSEREAYYKLKTKVGEMKKTLDEENRNVKDFKLTTHCSSVGNLIDKDKLREIHLRDRQKRIENVLDIWNKTKPHTLESFQDILKEENKWDVFGFYYIDWSKPFDFVREIDLTDVCKHLKAKSQPWVNTYTLAPTAENSTSYCYYTDNPRWVEELNNGLVDFNGTSVDSAKSTHICSKICMFQFLPMNRDLIEGLVDCNSCSMKSK